MSIIFIPIYRDQLKSCKGDPLVSKMIKETDSFYDNVEDASNKIKKYLKKNRKKICNFTPRDVSNILNIDYGVTIVAINRLCKNKKIKLVKGRLPNSEPEYEIINNKFKIS